MKKILINSISNFVSRFGINLLSFFTLPIFIKYFGDPQYSVFILINSVVESLVFFDFGVGTAFGKKTSEFAINRDTGKYRLYFNWTFWFTLIVSLVCGVLVFIFSNQLVSLFKIDPAYRDVGVQAFRIGSIYLILYAVLRIYQTALEGFEKFVLVNSLKVFQVISILASIWLVVGYKLSFNQYLIINMLGNLIPFLLYAWYFHQKYEISFQSAPDFKQLWGSDFWKSSKDFFVIQVTSFLFTLADKFIISIIIGATQVLYYTVVTKVAFIIRMVNNQTLIVINPIIAKAKESGNKDLIERIIMKGAMYQFLMMLPLIVTSGLMLKSFISLWIGGDFIKYSSWGVLALSIYLLGPFSAMVQRVLIFGGYEARIKYITIWLVLINLAVSIVFTFFVGIGGVIIGSVVQSLIAIPIFKRLAKNLLQIEYSILDRHAIIALGISILTCIGFYYFGMEKWVDSWVSFVMIGILLFCVLFAYPGYTLFKERLIITEKTS